MIGKPSPHIEGSYRFSIAPMMDCTDRHFRVLMRQITRRSLLYTEMVVANALHHTVSRKKILDFDPVEHPLALQIGGDDPKLLAEATRLAESWGYDEVNLNIGCPSPRVQSGNFGACLMANPDQVARCIEAMREASTLPITIKHRIGIDNLDSKEFLKAFIDQVAKAGAKRFIVHARKAILEGLNPKQNRTIPPLEYEKVAYIKEELPNLIIELNGGLNTPQDCLEALTIFDGVMVGRAAYSHPLRWQAIDELIYGDNPRSICASSIINRLIPYAEKHLNQGGKIWDIGRHLLNLVEGVPGAKAWRKQLTLQAQKSNAEIKVLENAAQALKEAGL